MPEFNTKYLEEVSGGNQQFILEMLQIFLSRTPEVFEILRKSVQEEDWETIGFYAHKLKATYAYVGLEELKKVFGLKTQEEVKKLIEFNFSNKGSILLSTAFVALRTFKSTAIDNTVSTPIFRASAILPIM